MSEKRLLKNLEEYIFSQDREATLGKLLPDTDEYTYLRLTDEIIRNKGVLTEEMEVVYERLVGSHKNNYDFKKGIKIRKLLYDLSAADSDDERKQICKKLNSCISNIKFNHKRPKIAEGMATETGGVTKRESSITLGPGSSDIGLFVGEKGGFDDNSLSSIKSGYIIDRDLDEIVKTIVDKSPSLLPSFLNRLPTLSTIKNLTKYVLLYFKKESSPNYEMIFKRMTQSELLALGNEAKDIKDLTVSFVNELYYKSFPDHPIVLKITDIGVIKSVYLYALNSKLAAAYPDLKRMVLKHLLAVMAKERKTDAEFLEDFIKNPSETSDIFSKKVTEKWRSDYTYFNFIQDPGQDIAELVTNHLRLLSKAGQDIERFSSYFNQSYYSKLMAEIQLKNGERIERTLEIFTKTELDFLNDEKYISFAEKNRDFKPDEQATLKLEIKNISELTMKVFEINTANYCREFKTNVQNNVALDGLVSISEKVFKYEYPSIVVHEETFDVEIIQSKNRGVFVVDFLGSDTTSRAILRKGYLSIIMKKTRTGYNCKILDEQLNVCKGADTGFYLSDTFYSASEDGTIKLPYPNSSSTGKQDLILQHEHFCYVVSQNLETEDVQIYPNWIYNEETFLPGQKSTLVLHVSMFVSGILVPLSNIQSTSLEVEFTRMSNVKSSQKVDSLALKDTEDYEYNIYLPNNTKQIRLNLTFTYLNLKGESVTKNAEHNIYLFDRQSLPSKTHIFLRRESDGYNLYHLGKNGEPIVNTELAIKLKQIWKRDRASYTVVTDHRGRISMGELPGVTMIGVSAVDTKDENLMTYFNIWDELSNQGFEQLIRTEGEPIQLPVLSQYEEKGIEFILTRVNRNQKTLIENCSDKVVKKNGFYVIDHLAPGDYVFRYTKSAKKVDITIVTGRYLSDDLILTGEDIYRQPEKGLIVSNIIGQKFDQEASVLELHLDKFGPSTRVHVFSQTYLDEGENKKVTLEALNTSPVSLQVERQSKISRPKIDYLEDRQLPGEMIYAMNRKNNDPAIGTTSEKPALFIKRQEIRATSYLPDEVTHGTEFQQDEEIDEDAEEKENLYDYSKPKYGRRKAKIDRTNTYFDCQDDYSNTNDSYGTATSANAHYFERMRHFLKTPSVCVLNLHPDAQGRVKIPLGSIPTRTLKIFIVNNEKTTGKTIRFDGEENLDKVDLRLQTASDSDKMFAYERDVYKVKDGVKVNVPGFSTSEYELITNISKLIAIKTELSGESSLQNWDFLKNWDNLKIGQKLSYVNDMFSYELAIFLFKKDRDFFDVTLKEFIKCKVKKTLLDYYMLGDISSLKSYLISSKLVNLNTVEKICLLDAFSVSDPRLATSILQSFQGQDSVNIYEDTLAFSVLFDRIVNTADKRGGKIQLKRAEIGNKMDECQDDDESSDEQSEGSGVSIPRPRYGGGGGGRNDRKETKRIQRNFIPRKEQEAIEDECFEECEQEPYDLFGDDHEEQEQISSNSDEDEDVKFDLMRIKKARVEPNVSRLQQASVNNTKEYREMGYYFQTPDSDTYQILPNIFWVDLARFLISDRTEPFLSENFVYVENQHIPFAVAFIEFGQKTPEINFASDDKDTFLTLSGGNGLLFLKHLKEREQVIDTSNTVLAAQKWFDKEERFEYNLATGVTEEKTIDWFIKGRLYGSQVVVTNVSSVEQKIQVITEVPQGSIPVYLNDFHQNFDLKLAAFSTQKYEFFFYFPESGNFRYCPACVTRDGKKVTVQTNSTDITVLDEPPKKTELKSIKDILAQGSKEDILAFMRKENINNPKIFSFYEIYWLLQDEQFYHDCLQILRERFIYDKIVWSYSLYHGDIKTLFEVLAETPNKVVNGLYIMYFNNENQETPLKLQGFRFLEYHPIVNARFHQLSKEKSSILNREFFDTYLDFLKFYFERQNHVGVEENLVLTYYLLLQDRIDEAFSIYSKIPIEDPALAAFSLQYDYMGAYFDLYKGMPSFSKAKTICEKYFDYPVISWRSLFIEIANQLAEIEGEANTDQVDKTVETAKGDEEVLRARVTGQQVSVDFANLEGLKIELFEINLEVLFSLNPFPTSQYEKLVFSQPHHTLTVSLTKSPILKNHTLTLPKEFSGKNLLLKISSSTGRSKSVQVYSYSQFSVNVNQEQGRLKVVNNGSSAPLSRVYVKVFIKDRNSVVHFFRDGYTDAAGGFNYLDVRSGQISNIQQFAVFLDDRTNGSLTMTIDPPKGQAQSAQKAVLVSSKMKQVQKEMMKKRYNNYSKGAYMAEEED